MSKGKPKPEPKRKMQGRKPTVPNPNRTAGVRRAFCTECDQYYNPQKQAEVNKHAH